MVSKTRKNVPWKGWALEKPNYKQRGNMYKKCGKKCFYGKKTRGKKTPSFPVCKKNTCKVSKKGVWAAYIRASEWGKAKKTYKTSKPTQKRSVYQDVIKKARKYLKM
jgi:hypothetical protein